ncbi:MAG TPA: hypothetical protein VK864_09630 [Longimicrobiales bacterium]|nr:hypothetical protein [Longimicrobiales bacterium]
MVVSRISWMIALLASAPLAGQPVRAPTPVVPADRAQPAPAQRPGTHEPPGMRTILESRGNDKFYGHSAEDPGPWFFGGRWRASDAVTVVRDPAAPFGSAIEKRFFAGDQSGWNGVAIMRWPAAAEVYFRMTFKFSPNWHGHPGGQKIWYWGSQGSSNYYIMMQSGKLRFHAQFSRNQGPGPDVAVYVGSSPARITFDQYHTIEVHHKTQSEPGANDGAVHVWYDGQYVTWSRLPRGNLANGRLEGMNFQAAGHTKIGGMQQPLYWGGGGVTKRANDWFRQAELVVKVKP